MDTTRVTVTILVDTDPVRMCRRLTTELAPHWRLAEALVTASRIFPVPAVAVGGASQVVECVLERTDGQPIAPGDLPSCLERFNVVEVRHHTPGRHPNP
jgi:hypothetical protein